MARLPSVLAQYAERVEKAGFGEKEKIKAMRSHLVTLPLELGRTSNRRKNPPHFLMKPTCVSIYITT
ncbi:hypothetical protein [Aggregatibacter sp.]